MALCTNDNFSQYLCEQNPLLTVEVITNVVQNSPWAHLLPSGTVEANIGEEISTLVTGRSAIGKSRVTPKFGDLADVCGETGDESKWGQHKFTTKLEITRGKSEPICVHGARYTVVDSYRTVIAGMKQEILEVYNADVRAQMRDLSGVKATLVSTDQTVTDSLTGGLWQVAAPWRGVLPSAGLTFKWLKAMLNYARTRLKPLDLFGTGSDQYAILVGSNEIIDALREQAPVNNSLYATTMGSFKDGKSGLWDYLFVDYNFRGLKFAEDETPLRFDALDASDNPDYIEPYTEAEIDCGYEDANNDLYDNAQYEIAFLVFNSAFRRRTPKAWLGEGDMKFASQLFGGELEWVHERDNCKNAWMDFGFFQYQIARAYQAIRPHSIIPIAFKRCQPELGLVDCSDFSDDDQVRE